MSRSTAEIQSWLLQQISHASQVPIEQIDMHTPISRYGMDSVKLIVLVGEIEEWLGLRLRRNPFEDYPTITELAQFLAEQVAS